MDHSIHEGSEKYKKVIVLKPDGGKTSLRPWRKCENIVRIYLKVSVNMVIGSSQGPIAGFSEHGKVPAGCIIDGNS